MPARGALAALEQWPVDHAAAAVVTAGGLVAGFGDLDRPFALASVTKPLVAWAVLVAVEERSLDLDTPAGPPGATVRHLLAHASGLAADSTGPLAPPGARRIYSNAGFEVLGAALAAATGFSVADYVREAVLAPLGMGRSELTGSPASGAVATAADLAAFAGELLAPTLVSGPLAAEARRVQFPGLDGVLPGFGRQSPNDWGLGVELRAAKRPHWTGTRNSPATFGHFGRAGTLLWVDPEAGVALVVLTDREFGPWAASAWPALADAVLAEHGR